MILSQLKINFKKNYKNFDQGNFKNVQLIFRKEKVYNIFLWNSLIFI